jgi:hypothetical protein
MLQGSFKDPSLPSIRLDDTDPDTLYVGNAAAGAVESDPVWKIKRIYLVGGVTVTNADGDTNADNVWSNRASLSYS